MYLETVLAWGGGAAAATLQSVDRIRMDTSMDMVGLILGISLTERFVEETDA